jgi:putative heme iron utilization protein
MHMEGNSEIYINYIAEEVEEFLEAYLNRELPQKLFSESVSEVQKLNEPGLSDGYMQNIAGSQFQEL